MRNVPKIDVLPNVEEVSTTAREYEWHVCVTVRIALTQLVDPQDHGIIEHGSGAFLYGVELR